MTADARRVRRARIAIFGPLAAGAMGVLLVAGGTLGFTLDRDVGTAQLGSPPPAAPASTTPDPTTQGAFILVGADGQLYALGDLTQPRLATSTPGEKSAPAPPKQRIVGAAGASTGGMWLATASGHVYPSTAPVLGDAPLTKTAAPVVGIAAARNGRGYRLVASDGHVYDFNTKHYEQPAATKLALAQDADVVGIATAATGGYWLAHRDGRVTAVGTRTRGQAKLSSHSAPVVDITATADGTGYWLVTADGHVHTFGAPVHGDLAASPARAHIVGMAPSGRDGYWLAAANGTVYPFNAPTFPNSGIGRPSAPIAAILPY